MDQVIFDNINEIVGLDDTLYILGDFCFKGKKPIEYRSRIVCQNIHLILGNHDRRSDFKDDLQGFSSVQDVKEIIYCNQKIFMSHYCHKVWAASHKGSIHLYAHSHSKFDAEDRVSDRKVLDVGTDNCVNYGKPFGQPFSFKEIQNIMSKYRQNI
jgi:calcineurin-like phosphoesterase family protein